MAKKRGGFFEQHIEKVVLAVALLLFLWLGFTRVVMTPNRVSFDNERLGPAEIDVYVYGEAKKLEDQLEGEPNKPKKYKPKVTQFVAALGSTVDIDTSADVVIPSATDYQEKEVRTYRIPAIGEITDVAVEHIRVVVYKPTVPVNEQNPYSQERSAPNDIDLVTVEAKFDVAQLYKDFHERFAGEYIPKEWRDPCLARLVFGAVELQRQELLEDGSWGEWQTVPRAQVEPHREMLSIIEDAGSLPPGGMRVRLLQFARQEVLMAILQPDAYRVASAEEEWFPPTIHKKYAEFQRKAELEERREAQEAERREREADRSPLGQGRRSARRFVGEEGELGGGRFPRRSRRALPGGRFGREPVRRGDRRSRSRSRGDEDDTTAAAATGPTSAQDFYTELRELLITREADLSKMREPLVFWAHDDTVEPGKTYHYRIRLGVLNPIAQTNWFSDQDRSLKNKAILWTEPSQVTEQVSIPKRLYFFPLQVAEAARTVNVQIVTYLLGYWYSKSFQVRQGEPIGRVVENYTEAPASRKASETGQEDEGVEYPERIDYSTGAIMVDVTPVNDWLGGDGRSLRSRQHFDMLYTIDGSSMAQMPVEPTNWPTELKVMNSEIRKAVAKTHKSLRGWQTKIVRRLPAAGAADQYKDEDEDGYQGYMGR